MSEITAFHVLDTGHCLAREHHVLAGGARRTIQCHALVFLLRHAALGWILFDTGYAPRMFEATRWFPYRLYRWLTPLRISADQAVSRQLTRWDLRADDIRHIVLSHLHADHIAGLRDFSACRVTLTRAAWDDFRSRRGWRALKRAYLPALLPEDLASRATLVDRFEDESLPALGPTHDLAGDGTLRLVPLPGHARGQVGLHVLTSEGPLLLAADGCWHSRSYRELRPPHSLTHAIIDDRAQMLATLAGLHDFHRACPDVPILPTHCPEVRARYVSESSC